MALHIDSIEPPENAPAYYERPPYTLLRPHLNYPKLHENAEKVAPKFWGIPSSNILTPPIPNVENRLIQIKKILQHAPPSDRFGAVASWAFDTPVDDIKYEGEHHFQRVFKHRQIAPKSHHKKAEKVAPLHRSTLIERYRSGDNATFVLEQLQTQGDPVAETVIALESWRRNNNNPEVQSPYIKLGVFALELVVFATRIEEVTELIGQHAVELEQRQQKQSA